LVAADADSLQWGHLVIEYEDSVSFVFLPRTGEVEKHVAAEECLTAMPHGSVDAGIVE